MVVLSAVHVILAESVVGVGVAVAVVVWCVQRGFGGDGRYDGRTIQGRGSAMISWRLKRFCLTILYLIRLL